MAGENVKTAGPNGAQPRTLAAGAYGPDGRSAWLDVDWREHQRWVEVDGQQVNVIEMGPDSPGIDSPDAGSPGSDSPGAGSPIVFVHGLSGSWPNWLEQLPVLARHHRVLALDLPGFGHSPMPTETITISGYARLLDGLLSKLGVDAAALVGNSMGGFVSAELSIAYPQRVERLVLVSAAGISSYQDRRGMRAASTLTRVERIVAACTAWVASKSDAVARRPGLRNATLGLVVRHPSRLPAALAAEQIRGSGKPGFLQGLRANIEYPLRERLPEIACPTLIVWGDEDRVISVRDADVFEQLIPDSRKVVFRKTGHMAMLERPTAFNDLLERFLAEGPGGRAA
jgi:pimeloyl-ACP methyl ester carboxylesterase